MTIEMPVRFRGLLLAVLVCANTANAFVAPVHQASSLSSLSAQQLQPDVSFGVDNRLGINNDVGYRNSYYNRNNMRDALPRQRAKRANQRYASNERQQRYNDYYASDQTTLNMDPMMRMDAQRYASNERQQRYNDYYASDQTSLNMDPMMRRDASTRQRGAMSSARQSTVQGAGSRATWVSPDPYVSDEMNVHLGTAGRPLYAQVEHWVGPNNVPSRMQLYSEDGSNQPWITKFKTPANAPSGVTEVRNTGPMEFPINARVSGSGPSSPTSTRMTRPQTIHGGALKTYSFDPYINQVYLEISSEGRPVNARVELWQGPSNTKAFANVYTDDGRNRPWSALIPLPGYGGSICVINEGPMEFPFEVSMDPPPNSAF